ncbi:hypothetical protein [uncultured Roseibium sp.]|uniref:hypothetical protein n=1 Tax=uncultured Roseibium sp. TaxID=1936171 RepID=UPI0032168140
MRLCDRVTVLRDGAVAGEAEVPRSFTDPAERQTLEAQLVRLMIGRNRPEVPSRSNHIWPTVLSVRKLTDGERFGPVDLDVHGGEIVAVVGVEGNGQAEFVELLIGLRKATARWRRPGRHRHYGHDHASAFQLRHRPYPGGPPPPGGRRRHERG